MGETENGILTSCGPSAPEAATCRIPERLFGAFWVPRLHVVGCPQYLKCVVKRQKGLEQVCFIPKDLPAQHQVLGIFGGQIDVMEVDQYALVDSGKDLQVLVAHIAVDFDNMGRVDEQDVILSERLKQAEAYILDTLLYDFHSVTDLPL